MTSVRVPEEPRTYHIAHIDRLASIVADKYLWCDAEVICRGLAGTNIGMSSIKQRRLMLALDSYLTCVWGTVCRSTSARAP
ncbi:DarT ssDNA thymidine ADP-ribosyltransferase family protein [Chloracidobacterium thermophilum]|uniref:DarT ssDNA thymidine ADP-ribosyltransferase family protein n=1 Tax=Chloracidobacterium thermophilum TaxID=458033 RepID=UPI00387E967F